MVQRAPSLRCSPGATRSAGHRIIVVTSHLASTYATTNATTPATTPTTFFHTAAILKAIFPDEQLFAHHPPLPPTAQLSDEGAANHLRLSRSHGEKGLEIFVYGRAASDQVGSLAGPALYPARQSREASQSIARLHQLDPSATLFIQQNPYAVDHGVFHNDVVAVANQNVLLYHASAFAGGDEPINETRRRLSAICASDLIALRADEAELPLSEAVASYLFNSQLVTLPDGSMSLIAPTECLEYPRAKRFIDRLLAEDNPIRSVHYVHVRQSMQNGGGPACLRLRMLLARPQFDAIVPSILLTDSRYTQLAAWINRHYRETLTLPDLADPALLRESRDALHSLTQILGLEFSSEFKL